jgi:hypothetical protein
MQAGAAHEKVDPSRLPTAERVNAWLPSDIQEEVTSAPQQGKGPITGPNHVPSKGPVVVEARKPPVPGHEAASTGLVMPRDVALAELASKDQSRAKAAERLHSRMAKLHAATHDKGQFSPLDGAA